MTKSTNTSFSEVRVFRVLLHYPSWSGSDIKELNVIEYARQHGLDDPAIISAVQSSGICVFEELCFREQV